MDTVTGTYTDTLGAANGCDSIVTLNLVVGSAITYVYNASICAGTSYSFNGTDLTTAGSYTDTIVVPGSCDSIITVDLVVNEPSFDTIVASICIGNNYSFNGETYTATGLYTTTLTNAEECDSFVTLNLTVDSLPKVVWKLYEDTICAFDTLALTGGSPLGGAYSGAGVTGSTFIPPDMLPGTYLLAYSYTDSNSCTDSARQTFVVDPCEGINSLSVERSITLYPNPASDVLILQSDIFTNNKMIPAIYDITGRMITVSFVQQNNKIFINTANLAMGTYCVRLNIDGLWVSKRFVKTE